MLERGKLKRLYWEEGKTLDAISRIYHYSGSGIAKIFRRFKIPTSDDLIRHFPHYIGDETEYYIRYYMDNFNGIELNGNRPRWIVRSSSEESINSIGRYITDNFDVKVSLTTRKRGRFLQVYGLRDCLNLTTCLASRWQEILEDIRRKSPHKMYLNMREAENTLLIFMNNGDWYAPTSLAEEMGWKRRNVMNAIYSTIEKGFVERRGEKGHYEYRLVNRKRERSNDVETSIISTIAQGVKTSGEISELTSIKLDTVRAGLRRLYQRGEVQVVGKIGAIKIYQLSENSEE